ncbi:MAG: hypothetical protein ACE5FR_12680 [Rhodospirillales bacterium]
MRRTTMFAVALALTLLGLAGCETAYGPKAYGVDRLNVGVGSAPATKPYGGYPGRGKNILFRTRVNF